MVEDAFLDVALRRDIDNTRGKGDDDDIGVWIVA